MKCFSHQEVEAVGICHICGKALCPDCAQDLGFALTCEGECVVRAERNEKMIFNNALVLGKMKSRTKATLFFYISTGLVFSAFDAFYVQKMTALAFIGPLFIFLGIYQWVKLHSYFQQAKD